MTSLLSASVHAEQTQRINEESNPTTSASGMDSFADTFPVPCPGVGMASCQPRPEKRVPPPRDSEESGARTHGCRRFGRIVGTQGTHSSHANVFRRCLLHVSYIPASNFISRDIVCVCEFSRVFAGPTALCARHTHVNRIRRLGLAIPQTQNRGSTVCRRSAKSNVLPLFHARSFHIATVLISPHPLG